MESIAHPKDILKESDLQIMRANSFISEKREELVPEVLRLIYQREWLRIMEPKSCGGLEWALPETVQLFEALAWADANVGWCVNLGAGANMFAGYFNKKTSREIFESKKTWVAGSGAISGKARKTGGGNIVSGKWKYASGSAHATHFTANCFLTDEHNKTLVENEKPVFRSFIFQAKDVNVINTWKVMGLKATSSNNFEVDNLFVPEEHTFSLLQPSDFAKGPLFQFPFDVLATINMAAMPTGIALHFIDLFQETIHKKIPLHSSVLLKDNEQVQIIFARATEDFYEARKKIYQLLNEIWAYYEKGNDADMALIKKVYSSAGEVTQKARDMMHSLYPLCGMSIVYTDSELNKVWRDMAVACQHYLLSPLHSLSN